MTSFTANKHNKLKRNVQLCFGRKHAKKSNAILIIKLDGWE